MPGDITTIKRDHKLGYEAGKEAAKSVLSPTDPMHLDGDVSWQEIAEVPIGCKWLHVWKSGFIIGYFEGNESLVPFKYRGFYTHAEMMNESIWRLT